MSFEELRHKFDGNDIFMSGHNIRGGGCKKNSQRKTRATVTDPWAFSDEFVRKLLVTVFPTLNTPAQTTAQRARAARWCLIINYYFRQGLPAGRIAAVLVESQHRDPNEKDIKAVEATIRRIRKAANGLTSHGHPRRGRTGRPKRLDPQPIQDALVN